MKAKITRYLIPLLILTIIITFCSFSCSPPSPGDQTIEEPAQKTIEENSIKKSEEELAEEEVIQAEPKEESTSEQKTKTIKETTDETIEANPIETEETSSKKNTPDITFPIRVKTLVLNYDPGLGSQGNKYLHELCGWNNPRELARRYIDDLNKCSDGKVIYEIIDWIDTNDIIPYTDGFKYTGETFYEYFQKASSERWDWWSWNGWHAHENNQATGMADYRWIINNNNLISRLNSGEIDEVFIFAQPFSGMYESLMIGPSPIWCNSDPLVIPELNKNFIIMSFNYEREVDCMLENFGHRVESILSYVFSNKDIEGINYWEKFTLYDKTALVE